MKSINTTLLPINSPVLPGGRKELRLVTPGQKGRLAMSLKGGESLAVCVSRKNNDMPCYPMATLVKVVDFHQLDDGSMAIMVEGQQRVEIVKTSVESDGVWLGKALPMMNWPSLPIDDKSSSAADALRQLYDARPELGDLYPEHQMGDACWVSQRLLEVLPLVEPEKQKLINQPDCGKTIQYVMSLINQQH